jgi:PAS domain S-box-containing protein
MQMLREHPWYADGNAQRLTSFAFVLIAVIAAVDSVLILDVGFGFLYFIPLCVAAAFLSRWQILIVAAICTAFTEGFASFQDGPERIPRVVSAFLAYTFVAFVMRKVTVFSRVASRRLNELEQEVSLWHRAEEQLEMLINSSSAGIVTISPDGIIMVSNEAVHQLFGVAPGGLSGQPLGTFLPSLAQMRNMDSRATVTCRAIRADGTTFMAVVALSKFTSATGSATAAIIFEQSNALRGIEEASLP